MLNVEEVILKSCQCQGLIVELYGKLGMMKVVHLFEIGIQKKCQRRIADLGNAQAGSERVP